MRPSARDELQFHCTSSNGVASSNRRVERWIDKTRNLVPHTIEHFSRPVHHTRLVVDILDVVIHGVRGHCLPAKKEEIENPEPQLRRIRLLVDILPISRRGKWEKDVMRASMELFLGQHLCPIRFLAGILLVSRGEGIQKILLPVLIRTIHRIRDFYQEYTDQAYFLVSHVGLVDGHIV